MDVGELLTFKPVTAPKRPAPGEDKDEEEFEDDPNDSYEKRAAKRRKRAKAEARRSSTEGGLADEVWRTQNETVG